LNERYQVLKIDLDIKVRESWLKYWVYTRVQILNQNGIEVTNVITRKSARRGYHIWFHLRNSITYDQVEYYRFLCGDDTSRIWFHRQRRGFVNRKFFDLLFSEKKRIEDFDVTASFSKRG